MDPLSVVSSSLVVWFLKSLADVWQGTLDDFGKEAAKGIMAAVHGLVAVVHKRLTKSSDPQGVQVARDINQKKPVYEDALIAVLDREVNKDPQFAQDLSSRMQLVRNVLLDTLDKRFTVQDLNEIYFRLNEEANKLAGQGAPHKAKAAALIEYAETRGRLPEVLQTMIAVNPSIVQDQ